jgi:hypothetical protein
VEHLPKNLRIHLLYIWSDGFQKTHLKKQKKTSLQLFTVYAVPPDGVQDIARYTIPFAFGKKSDHQPQLIKILRQTKGLEKVTSRFCKDTNSCEPTWFEQVVIQNGQVKRVNNLLILQGSTYGKQVGHSIEFNEKTPSCKKCFLSRLERLFPSDTKILNLKPIDVKNVLIC